MVSTRWYFGCLNGVGGAGKRLSLGLQLAQSRSYVYTLGPKVGIISVLGALLEGSGDLVSRL